MEKIDLELWISSLMTMMLLMVNERCIHSFIDDEYDSVVDSVRIKSCGFICSPESFNHNYATLKFFIRTISAR